MISKNLVLDVLVLLLFIALYAELKDILYYLKEPIANICMYLVECPSVRLSVRRLDKLEVRKKLMTKHRSCATSILRDTLKSNGYLLVV